MSSANCSVRRRRRSVRRRRRYLAGRRRCPQGCLQRDALARRRRRRLSQNALTVATLHGDPALRWIELED